MADFNATLATLRVSRLFLKARSTRGLYGSEVAKELEINQFTAYSILKKLENAALLQSSVEQIASWAGREPRRLYQMTEVGKMKFEGMLAQLQLAST